VTLIAGWSRWAFWMARSVVKRLESFLGLIPPGGQKDRGAPPGHPPEAPLPPLDVLSALEDERRLPPVVIPVLIGASAARTTRW